MNDDTPSTHAATAPPRPRRRWPLWLGGGVLVLFGALFAAGAWLWTSGAAQSRLLQEVPGLSLEGWQGRVTGGSFALDRLRWQGGEMSVEVDGLQWQGLSWRWRPHAGAWLGLALDQPQARAVRVVRQPTTPPPASQPLQAPESLRLPLALSLRHLKIGSVQLDGQELFSGFGGDVELAADAGASHRIRQLRLSRGDLQVSGELSIGTDGDLPLDAKLALAMLAEQPLAWQASVQAAGPLRKLQVDADLKTPSGASLTAKAAVTAFADWPLAALALQARDLDLSTLAPGLPETALSGTAELGDVTVGQPLSLQLAMDNAKPGPWDTGRLPVRSARGALQGRPSAPDRLAFDGWLLGIGRGPRDGQLALNGTWQGAQLDVQLQLQAVQAAQLHTQAPNMALDGTLGLQLSGLAVPGSAPATVPQPLEGTAKLALQGRLAATAAGAKPLPPLSVRSDISFGLPADGGVRVELREFAASAGAARAVATLEAVRNVAGAWSAKSQGQFERVDLAAWWPAAGPSDLNGAWQADLQLPSLSPGATADALLAALRGEADLALQRSQMSGVALSAKASLKAQANRLLVDAQVQAAENRLQLNGQTDAQGEKQNWRAELAAPSLQALAPLLKRIPGARDWLPEAGGVQGTATASGAWPALRSEGQLQIDGLRMAQGRVDKGSLRWTFNGLTLDAPLSLEAEVSGMAQAERRIDSLKARLEGSLREHRVQLQLSSPLRPPAWTDSAPLAAASAISPADGKDGKDGKDTKAVGSSLQLQAQGRWQPAAGAPKGATLAGAGEWQGRVTSLRAGPRAQGAAPWLQARDLRATVILNAQSQPTQATLAPGRIEAFGGALAWQQAQWQAPERPGGASRIDLQAQLEPLQVAPILARLQPEFGWRGDLVIAGKASVRSAARFDADIAIERQSGDLSLLLAGGRRNLELSTLRVALAAHDGKWVVSQAVVGQQIGVFGGSQTLQTTADAVFPPAPTPLAGGLSLRVSDASIWAPWLPPGWRLGGALTATAALGGTLGSPTIAGELLGENLQARNIFEGINLQEGTVRIALDSSQAVIETFRFQGGDRGTLNLQGSFKYANAPQADLKLALDKFRVLDRVDRRLTMSGNADIGLRAGRLSVNGRLGIDEGLIDVTAAEAPSLSDDVVVVGRTDAQGRPVAVVDGGRAALQGVLASTDIDVRLALGDALRLRGAGLDTGLRGQLRITTPAAGKLQVRGVVNTVDGSYTAYGQNLAIRRGTISFSGDATNPRLDILALRADIDYPVGVIVSGFAIDPRVRLYSDPDLPEVEQLTWLLTGQAPQGQGRDESALLQRAALALLAGDRGASDEGFLQKLGLDQFGVGRTDGGDTVVTVGKQLSKRLSIVYEKGLSAAGGTWALLYRVAGRTTLRARTGVENSAEVIWTWRWD